LKLAPNGSVCDLLDPNSLMSEEAWAQVITGSQGLDVITAPDHPYSEMVGSEAIEGLLAESAARYDWVIVDAPNVFQPVSLIAMAAANSACLVATTDLSSLHLTRRAITLLGQIGLAADRYRIVLNRVNRRESITQQDVERVFKAPVFYSVPNEYFSVHRAISLGQPLAMDSELGRAIAGLASRLAAPAPSATTASMSKASTLARAQQ
jgi:Flp pilus assembly CpaE family ATPase